ncbi:MAG: hypothetical protein C5B49_14700 [Bdellovibrio sp.]|nr:MAG: hypothetical protein C5B49_14700 [Bdellovibrio sp.]
MHSSSKAFENILWGESMKPIFTTSIPVSLRTRGSFAACAGLILCAMLFQNCSGSSFKIANPNEEGLSSTLASGGLGSSSPSTPPSQVMYQSITVRRLSNVELTNSIQDVFMSASAPAVAGGSAVAGGALPANLLPQALVRNGYDNQIDALGINLLEMTNLQAAAEAASAYVVQNFTSLVTCVPTQASCIQSYITATGRRAFRRPLTGTEMQEYLNLYNTVAAADTPQNGFAAVLEAMILSPNFVFRTELGSSPSTPGTAQLTPYEVAAAISYFILASAPDNTLLDAAANGQLATAAQRAAQAQRLLQLPEARTGVLNFMLQWADIKSASLLQGILVGNFPQFSTAQATAAINETAALFSNEIFNGQANWKNLFTSTTDTIDSSLASIYGTSASGGTVQLDPTQRSGFLTEISFIGSHSNTVSFSPVHFGLYVYGRLFCKSPPNPPASRPPLPPAQQQGTTLSPRQQFAQHETNPFCASCHASFDPMGWAFELYDPLAEYKPTFNGSPLTGAGSLPGTDVSGNYAGVPQMASQIANSQEAQACFVRNLYLYALGRPDVDPFDNTLSSAVDTDITQSAASFTSGQTNILNLYGSVVGSDAFVNRRGGSQ